MNGVLVDSNVILDIFLDDPNWYNWSENTLVTTSNHSSLFINPIIYSEVSVGFDRIDIFESAIIKAGFKMVDIPKEALFLAGKAFLNYKKSKGIKRSPLSDFYIGAHAAVLGIDLITRDTARYRTYFPTVKLISPSEI